VKVINDLLGFTNLKIVQDTEYFNFSLDSVLLPNFVTLNKSIKKILDIGTGNIPIPLILTTKTKAQIVGVEIQKEIYDLAYETLKINKLEKQISIINADINEIAKTWETETFDVITCNPPFFTYKETSNINKNVQKTIARHEINLTLDNIFSISKKLLKNNGVIAIVHRPERLVDIISKMRQNNIEPKKVQFIYPKTRKEAHILLIEGRKNGRPGLKILPPIYVHDENGNYVEEIKALFEK